MSGIKISVSTGNLMSLAFSSSNKNANNKSMSPEEALTNESNHKDPDNHEKKIGGKKNRRMSASRGLSFDTVTSTTSATNHHKKKGGSSSNKKTTEEELMADMFKTATELEDLAKKARRRARRRRNSCEDKAEKEGVPPRTASTGNFEDQATRRRRSRSRNGKPRRTKSTGTTEDMAAVPVAAQQQPDDDSVGSTGSIFSTFSNLLLSQSRRSNGSQKENRAAAAEGAGKQRRRSRSLVGLGRRRSTNANSSSGGPPTSIKVEQHSHEQQEEEGSNGDNLMDCSHCDLLDASACRRQRAEDLANQYKPTYYYDSGDDDDDLLLDPTENLDVFARNAEREVLNMTIAFSHTTGCLDSSPPQAA